MGKPVPSPTVTSKVAADRDPRKRRQDGGKRVSLQQLSDLRFQGSSLFVDGRERACQGGGTTSRGPVSGTTTVCSSNTSKTLSISRVAMRGALGRITSRRPGFRKLAGDP